MTRNTGEGQDERLLRALESLLALDAVGLDEAMTHVAQRLVQTLAADKVEVLLHDPATE
jgi:hypothetical protein